MVSLSRLPGRYLEFQVTFVNLFGLFFAAL
jgi:hypothetical protein